MEKRLAKSKPILAREGFWNKPDEAKTVLKERTSLSNRLERFRKLAAEVEDNQALLEMAVEESDEGTLRDLGRQATNLLALVDRFALELMLDGEDDGKNAIVSINAGAGGTEAQDWAEILFRMYTRWVERKGYKSSSSTTSPARKPESRARPSPLAGDNAFGYLKSEGGVHRLVRISPFNASGKRHTSFASVFVYPELDNEIVVDIEEKDLRIDVFRASGSGGQHVNKTSSAVRITHLPSGIVVQCQQEKSQFRNKELALKVLRARLHQREKQKQDEKLQEMHDSKEDIAWGNQIRSYVLQPYQLVKDHRINLEIGNVNEVLDGGIDPFIEGVLLAREPRSPGRPDARRRGARDPLPFLRPVLAGLRPLEDARRARRGQGAGGGRDGRAPPARPRLHPQRRPAARHRDLPHPQPRAGLPRHRALRAPRGPRARRSWTGSACRATRSSANATSGPGSAPTRCAASTCRCPSATCCPSPSKSSSSATPTSFFRRTAAARHAKNRWRTSWSGCGRTGRIRSRASWDG